jgi:hypothetical protein
MFLEEKRENHLATWSPIPGGGKVIENCEEKIN